MSEAPNSTANPMYWRAEHLARVLGVNKKLLIADARAGRLPVPVRLAHFGASGIAYVRVDDARALVQALNTPNNGGTL